ncbi:hypothetical protein ACFQS7_21610 [Dankookia sp. GCM10030260]|uniref:hypothetical protein n=1 Tax=Dankookia sp. GCM10030260 TaxID=3273390 RepID=UPI00361EF98E
MTRRGDASRPATPPFTRDAERSGVIDVTALLPHEAGERVFLLDTQAHHRCGRVQRPGLVEGGQMPPMHAAANGDGHSWAAGEFYVS